MTTYWNRELFDRYIAPNASEFRGTCLNEVADEFDQHTHWLANFFLNTVLRNGYKVEYIPYVTAFLRRAEGAFFHYGLAREAMTNSLRGPQANPSRYARTLMHWEGFVGQAATAHAVLIQLIQQGDPAFRLFSPGDGSIEQRLWHMNNCMKHVEKRIASGQLLPDAVSPVWMSNDGLHVTDSTVTWTEVSSALREIGDCANRLQDAATWRERLTESE